MQAKKMLRVVLVVALSIFSMNFWCPGLPVTPPGPDDGGSVHVVGAGPASHAVTAGEWALLLTLDFSAYGEDFFMQELILQNAGSNFDSVKVEYRTMRMKKTFQELILSGTQAVAVPEMGLPEDEHRQVKIYGKVSHVVTLTDTFQVDLLGFKARGKKSGKEINSGQTVVGNPMTVVSLKANVQIEKLSAYGDQELVKPQFQARIAVFVLKNQGQEKVTIDQFHISNATNDAMQNMKLVDNDSATQYGSTKVTLVTDASTANVFIITNLELAAGETKVINVLADIKYTATSELINISVAASGQTEYSIHFDVDPVVMQAITIVESSVRAYADGGMPKTHIIIAGTEFHTMMEIVFTGDKEDFILPKVDFVQTIENANDNVLMVVVEYPIASGQETTALGYLDSNGKITFTGLSMYIPQYPENARMRVHIGTTSISEGADSGDQVQFDMTSYSAIGVTSAKAFQSDAVISGNPMIVRKTKPEIIPLPLPTTTLNNGTQTFAKVRIVNDTANDLYVRELNFACQSTQLVDIVNRTIYVYRWDDQSTSINDPFNFDVDSGIINIFFRHEEIIPAKSYKDYVAKGSFINVQTDEQFSCNLYESKLYSPTTGTWGQLSGFAGIVWSDGSAVPHTEDSRDYCDSKHVPGLPTDSWTLSK